MIPSVVRIADGLLMRLFMTESENLVSTSGRRDDEMPHGGEEDKLFVFMFSKPLKVASDVFSEFLINFASSLMAQICVRSIKSF